MKKDNEIFTRRLGFIVLAILLALTFWMFNETNNVSEVKDWKCSIIMNTSEQVTYSDTNMVISQIQIELPCSEAQTKNLATIKQKERGKK